MTDFQLVEGKAFHCGMMARALRREQADSVLMLGLETHRELRSAFDNSSFRRTLFIDEKIAAIGGITGSIVSSEGMIWLALTASAAKHRLYLVKLLRRQMREIMETKRRVICTILDGDEASERFAIFMGFVPAKALHDEAPSSRFGRMELRRRMSEGEFDRVAIGRGFVNVLEYRPSEAF